MSSHLDPAPIRAEITDKGVVKIGADWVRWFGFLRDAVNGRMALGSAELTAQDAAITATAVATPTLAAGLYRVAYAVRVTQAATTSSTVTVTVEWTDGGIAMSQSGAAVTGNTTATQQNGTLLVRIDAGTTIRYSTAYSSVGATSMQYALDVVAEKVA